MILPFLVASAAHGALIAVDTSAQVASPINAATGTLSFTVNGSNVGRGLLVVIGGENSSTPDSVTYGGQALTDVASTWVGSSSASIWYLADPAGGTADIVVTQSSYGNGYRFGAVSIYSASAARSSLQLVTPTDTDSSTSTTSLTLAPNNVPPNDFVLTFAESNTNNTISSRPSGSTNFVTGNSSIGGWCVSGDYVAAAGNTSFTYSINSQRAAAAGVTIRAIADAPITLISGNVYGTSWTQAADWSENAPASAGADYEVSISSLRTPTTSAVFPGDSLSILAGGNILLKGNGQTHVIDNLIYDGGAMSGGESTNNITIAGQLTINAGGIINQNGEQTISATVLGSGPITVNASNGVTYSSSASTWGGDLTLTSGNLSFNHDITGDDMIVSGGLFNINGRDHTFNSLTDDGSPITPGVYTSAELSSLFTGAGTITVIPEPSTMILATFGLLGLIRSPRRRRRQLCP